MLEKFNELNSKDKLTIICGVIILLAAIFVLGTGFNKNQNTKPVNVINNAHINTLIDKELGNNYTITINETAGVKEHKHIYYYDGKLKLYESTKSEYGYLEYNNNVYEMNATTKELTKYNEKISFMNNPLYDYDLIKKITDSCDYKFVSSKKVECNITLREYLKYHNEKYGTTYVGNDDYINIYISYTDKLNSIEINYTTFNKIVNLSNETINIKLSFRYNSNNFDNIYNAYKDILES